jgi:hypothetical protein
MLVQVTTPLEPGVVDHKVYVRGYRDGAPRKSVKGWHASRFLARVGGSAAGRSATQQLMAARPDG